MPVSPNSYDSHARQYADFADQSFSWLHIETPAIDDALADYYHSDTEARVLDIGSGSGRVIRHLINRGIPPESITGLDPSERALSIAAANLPQTISLVKAEAGDMPFSDESFHVAIANMVLNAMDNEQAEAMIRRVGEVLVPGGVFFFIDNEPDPDVPKNTWQKVQSPWSATVDVFTHDMDTILYKVAPRYGLTCLRTERLSVSEAGQPNDPAEYTRYSTGHFRLAALLRKTEDQ